MNAGLRNGLIVGAVVIFLGWIALKKPRGIRLNNPGNIKRNAIKWEGLSTVQDDPIFARFVTEEKGLRAMGVLLYNYRLYYGLDTVRKLRARYLNFTDANPGENSRADFLASLKVIEQETGIPADKTIDPRVTGTLQALLKGWTAAENGFNMGASWYSDAQYRVAANSVTSEKGAS